jgi:hypothetical protein
MPPDKELGISVQSLMGMKKTIFNSEDYGVITISTYAAEVFDFKITCQIPAEFNSANISGSQEILLETIL